MKIIVAAGGRFHAITLAAQLAKRNSLEKLLTFSYTQADEKNIPKHLVAQSKLCRIVDQTYCKLGLGRLIQASGFNVFKDNLFDRFISAQLNSSQPVDLFVGWAHYVLNSIPVIKKKAKKLILESGSCHILEQQEILRTAYQKLGLAHAPINPANVTKMLKEYELADYIVTPSTFAQKSFIRHGIAPKKVIVVACGTDINFFKQTDKQLPQKFTVLFVGLLSVRKGVHLLLDAWHKLALPQDEAQLILVGSLQKDLSHIITHRSLSANIIFYGSTDRKTLKNLYLSSSVLVLPSLEDGFGMVMGEAMASGIPVITTTHSGGPDIIEENINGFVVPADDVDALTNKLSWCFNHQTQTHLMGMQAQQQVDKLSLDAYGNNIYQAYQKIMENG